MSTQEKQKTPIDQFHDALIDKGYRRLARYGVTREDTVAFTMYTNHGDYVLMQEYKDGGAELFAPLTNANHIDTTIKAIP